MKFDRAIFWQSLLITIFVVAFSVFARFYKNSDFIIDINFILLVIFGVFFLFFTLYAALYLLRR